LVRVEAAALNYRDLLMIDNGMGGALSWPFTPGSDMAGILEAIGEGVEGFQVGERVIGTFWHDWYDGRSQKLMARGGPLPGVLAEKVILEACDLVRAPGRWSPVQAATLPCAGLTAWMALVEQGGLKAGQRVLVQGTGGVALYAVQLAAALGAETLVLSGDAEKIHKAQALGAVHGILRDAHREWSDEVLRMTQGAGVDHVLELVGGDNLSQSLNALAPDGHVALVGLLGDMHIRAFTPDFIMRRARLQGISVGPKRALEALVRAVDSLGLEPVIAAEYPLHALRDALGHARAGAFGKIVMRVD
ncbi:MAG: NAD(P)-dependent alcohol dehydrogenase, partial [Gammaproteobacteria bacterium]|nr:NAD(P)-dependent alcohol dehydrogenase [Gammaproteobacteria bacterium]